MTHSFDAWKGSLPVVSGDFLDTHDLANGAVIEVYHGTTHPFDVFDPSINGWAEGQFGAVNYFTTSHWDAQSNYTDQGPDLENRIQERTERLSVDIEDDLEAFGLPEDASQSTIEETAEMLARRELIGSAPRVLSLYVRTTNPFFLGGDKWFIPCLPSIDSMNLPDCEDEEWEEAWDEAHAERYTYLEAVFEEAADILGYDGHIEIPAALLDDRYDGTAQDLETIILAHHTYLECLETGRLLSHALVGAVVQAMGFDSIILLNADKRFRSMTMEGGTAHIHTFGKAHGNIKSTDATSFNPDVPNHDD